MDETDLLELLDGTRVDTTALVDQVTGGGRLAGIDVADNDDVDVGLVFLTVGGVKSAPCRERAERSSRSRAARQKQQQRRRGGKHTPW